MKPKPPPIMPLRITIELIPRGDESRKEKLAVVDIENDGTAGDMRGGGDVGNYRVVAFGSLLESGWDEFADFTIGPLKRGDHVDTCIEILSALHSTKMPPHKSLTGHIENKEAVSDCIRERSAMEQTMIVCTRCGNKRCPHATDHRMHCTHSNALGQVGQLLESAAAPETTTENKETDGDCQQRLLAILGDIQSARLTAEKTKALMERDGYIISGFTLVCPKTGRRAIVEMSSVRWLSKEESWLFMHKPQQPCLPNYRPTLK